MAQVDADPALDAPDKTDARVGDAVKATAPADGALAVVEAEPAITIAPEIVEPFDPFGINVIVVLRTAGKDAALEALNQVADTENLRLLAREQRLSVDEDLATTEALSAAIVAAAERRIANRRAAAGA